MANQVVTNLIARDNMSGPLRKISAEADKVESNLKGAGTSAADAGKKLQRAGDEGARSIGKLGDAADNARSRTDALNTGLAGLGAGLMYASKMAMQEEQQVIGLTRAYGDAADEMLQFAEQLDGLTMFSDQDIRGGERYFASLRNNYDLSIEQIQELMQVTADLASASGTSFEDASSRVTAAIRGEGEAAEYLGLTMNQQSIDRQNLTLTMSNQEAAQFRLNALNEQAAMYAGTAADMNNTQAGTIANVKDKMDDYAASIGQAVGPMGTLISGAGALGLGMTGLASGANIAKVGLNALAAAGTRSWAALGPLGVALGAAAIVGVTLWQVFNDGDEAMGEASQSAEALATSMQSLDQMIKQTAISGDFWLSSMFQEWDKQAEAAVASVEGHVGGLWTDLDSFVNDGFLESGASGEGFVNWIDATFGAGRMEEALRDQNYDNAAYLIENGMYDSLSQVDLYAMEQIVEGWIKEMVPDEAQQKELADAMKPIWDLMMDPNVDQSKLAAEYQAAFAAFDDHGSIDLLVADLKALEDQTIATMQAAQLVDDADYYRMLREYDISDAIAQTQALQAATQEVQGQLSTGELRAYDEAWEAINDTIKDGSIYSDHINQQIANLTVRFKTGGITAEEYAQGIIDIYLGLDEMAASEEKLLTAIELTTAGMTEFVNKLGEITEEQKRLNAARAEFALTMDAATVATERGVDSAVNLAEAMRQVREEAHGIGASLRGEIEPIVSDMKAVEESIQGILELTGNSDIVSQLNLTSAATDATLLAGGINDATAAIENLQRVVVGNTDALGNQMQGLKDWSDALIGDPGVWAEVDALYAEGRISIEKYNQAQDAQVEITAANATVQRDLLAIQASQAPILAAGATGLAEYVEQLRQMNDGFDDTATGAQDQLAALALMDAGYQQQLLSVMQMADQLDDLGPKGEAAFKTMIDGMIALDPAMAAVLEQVGYIQNVVRDENGTVISYEVSIGGADGAMSEIERLTLSIDTLILTLGGVPPEVNIDVNADTSDAEEPITRTQRAADDFDGSESTGILNADGTPAMGSIGQVDESMNGINGKTSTVNIVANDQASSVIAGIAANTGRTLATHFVDIITRETPRGTPGIQSGGVVGFMSGGVVPVELAEAGPELLHFATGGTAYVNQRGIYAVPTGTYVTPNNALPPSSSPIVNVYVGGSVVTERELTLTIARAITAADVAELGQRRAGFSEVML